MSPALRRFVLTAHIVFSVGWFGAVAAFLALALAGLTRGDAPIARAAYVAMDAVGWYVIVPFSLSALLTGVVQSLGTRWGLFRHYWVLAKLALTLGATALLLLHMRPVRYLSERAATGTPAGPDAAGLRTQLAGDAGAALLVLAIATVLSVYKPAGMTPYGRRREQSAESTEAVRLTAAPTPRWITVSAIIGAGLLLIFAALHLSGHAPRGH